MNGSSADPALEHALAKARAAQNDLLAHWFDQRRARPDRPMDALCVRAGARWLAVPLIGIREVVAACWCEAMPESPRWVTGTFFLSDHPVVAVELARLADRELAAPPRLSQFVVVVEPAPLVGLIVDELGAVIQLDVGSIPLSPVRSTAEWVVSEIQHAGAQVGLLSVEAVRLHLGEGGA